jgi:hypothetical protein
MINNIARAIAPKSIAHTKPRAKNASDPRFRSFSVAQNSSDSCTDPFSSAAWDVRLRLRHSLWSLFRAIRTLHRPDLFIHKKGDNFTISFL